MTPAEKKIVKSLIAVAWADGQMAASESAVVEGLLIGFDASDQEERELLEWAKTPRTLRDDVPVADLSEADQELLLSNAALLTAADGEVSLGEVKALIELVGLLNLDPALARDIIARSVS